MPTKKKPTLNAVLSKLEPIDLMVLFDVLRFDDEKQQTTAMNSVIQVIQTKDYVYFNKKFVTSKKHNDVLKLARVVMPIQLFVVGKVIDSPVSEKYADSINQAMKLKLLGYTKDGKYGWTSKGFELIKAVSEYYDGMSGADIIKSLNPNYK